MGFFKVCRATCCVIAMNLLNVIARTSEGLGSGARMRVLLIVFQDWLVVLCFFPALKVLHGDPESKPSIGAIC